MTIGQRIRTKREEIGISQTELAYKVGVAKQTLYKYENDIITNIPSDVIERISYYLDCSPSYLMGWEEIPVLKPVFSESDTRLVNKIRNDRELANALQIYFSLPESKKKYIIETIRMISR